MLAHLKAKQREHNMPSEEPPAAAPQVASSNASAASGTESCPATKMTCDALCSLSYSPPPQQMDLPPSNETEDCAPMGKSSKKSCCPKQHQLPMFLSKTYHMIDRCDSSIATWSPSGDNFVVKNVEKFASTVLPMYFKHSNFSSFARQLNFYGFRKLKAEPILTADFDARTACYVRFYHEKFQKDRPELLGQIKRATKSDQQSKDDVESLKIEISKMKDCMAGMGADYDRRMSEMSYEYNRRITQLSAEYDKLAVLVQQILTARVPNEASLVAAVRAPAGAGPDMMHSLSQVAALSLQNSLRPPSMSAAAVASGAVQPPQKRPAESGDGSLPNSRPRLS